MRRWGAVRLYGEQLGRLSEEEREAKLAAFDELVPRIPSRAREEVEGELEELRETGWRTTGLGVLIVLELAAQEALRAHASEVARPS